MPAEPLGAMPKESPAEADGNCLFGVVVCEYPRGHESLSTRSFVTYMRLHRGCSKAKQSRFCGDSPESISSISMIMICVRGAPCDLRMLPELISGAPRPRICVTNAVWSRFVTNAVWSRFVTNAVWSRFVTYAVWSRFVTNAVWSRFVTYAVWSRFVTNTVWSRFVTNAVWSRFATNARWSRFVTNAVWSRFVTNARWSRDQRSLVTFRDQHS